MSQAASDHSGDAEVAARRHARLLARVRAEGRRLWSAPEILAEPRSDPDPPSEEEMDAFLDVIYEARDRDRGHA